MLRKPVLALTSDRTRMAQTNDSCGNPEDWFDSQPFEKEICMQHRLIFLWIGKPGRYVMRSG